VLLLVGALTVSGFVIFVRTFYDLESRRQRIRTIGYFVGWYAGFIGIAVLGLFAYTLSGSSITFLGLIAAVLAWWYGWPRLWKVIAPRLP
jgi:Kef-type K+ transport system membrane component KefB